ncbi:hypothetical protein CBM2615_B60010 [Cupriavidus taiwanensis]|uniref:Uncharacterized protein n=1 Tax=Cupriavidus taiwanensis TaxID=164546 RepID=A0A976G555_9BURK|nr:hypothetical protein CBM2614_B50011 [Cupriavidus taiwanensis]SOZ69649.1 hypothetical protein CBM2615_B60010 [Cupriavidus taiwanensis]SOZ72862.1 hypothetical protein CBM2613_B50010 [Cupriavidus taiwanensis]SPA09721.1 hypothetical protein CBM2625_B50010 [Cupriavidus taiwanensis]
MLLYLINVVMEVDITKYSHLLTLDSELNRMDKKLAGDAISNCGKLFLSVEIPVLLQREDLVDLPLLVETAFCFDLKEVIFNGAVDAAADDEIIVIVTVHAVNFLTTKNLESRKRRSLELHSKTVCCLSTDGFPRDLGMDRVHGFLFCPSCLASHF